MSDVPPDKCRGNPGTSGVSLFKAGGVAIPSHPLEMTAEVGHVPEAPLWRMIIWVLVWSLYFTLRLNSFAFLLICEQGIL